jgi:hypothetical protein
MPDYESPNNSSFAQINTRSRQSSEKPRECVESSSISKYRLLLFLYPALEEWGIDLERTDGSVELSSDVDNFVPSEKEVSWH